MSLREHIIMLLEAGKSNREICRLLNCSIQYVQDVRTDSGYVLNQPTTDQTRYSESYAVWFTLEWNAAVERIRRCCK